jgi:hypothetical protein
MAFYIDLSSARTTVPDQPALLVALQSTVDPAIVIGPLSQTSFRVKKPTLWTAPQIASAQNALDTVAARTDESIAQFEVDKLGIRERAILLTLLDQINLLRTQPTTVMSSVTPAQAIAAVRTKAGTL